MSDLVHAALDDTELVYRLLPALYRGRDTKGELRAFLSLFGVELGRLRAATDQLWRDLFIDSCQDWVVPYLADLVGTTVLANRGADNRADVRKTLEWRRRKGTLEGLTEVAATVSARGAHVVEMFERLVWSQHLDHRRPRAVHALDLARGSTLARLDTPFDLACRSVDLRPPGPRASVHRVRTLAVFLWALTSHRMRSDVAPSGSGLYRLHALGLDQPLYAGGEKVDGCDGAPADPAIRPDACVLHADHTPIRARDFHDDPLAYFGQPFGFTLYEDGIAVAATRAAGPSRSTVPALEFDDLAHERGLLVADPGRFGAGQRFEIDAVRVAALTTVIDGALVAVAPSPTRVFANQFVAAASQATLDTNGFAYAKGAVFSPGAPDFHHPVLVIRLTRRGTSADFPECEIVVRNRRAAALLVYLPAVAGLAPGQAIHFYVADDGATYFARRLHDPGAVDLNPDAALFGAYLGRHLAREAHGQVRPRPAMRPLAHRRAVYRDLCCWDRPLQSPPGPGEVAFDPERGRAAFAAGEAPTGELTADFRFATTGEIGAGPFARVDRPAATLTVSKAGGAEHATLQAAIDGAPQGGGAAVVIEILDSRVYAEALTVAHRSFPGGLVIQAADQQVPVLRPGGGAALTVATTSAIGTLSLDGLLIAGGDVTIVGDVPRTVLRSCSLDPRSVTLAVSPFAAGAALEIASCVTGVVGVSGEVDRVVIRDSIVQHPLVASDAPEGHVALAAIHDVELERVTVLGRLEAGRLLASNTILYGPHVLTRPEESCLRHSRHQAPPAGVRTFRCTRAFPVFASLRFGDPGYGHVHPNSAEPLRRGAEEGGEMGAFHAAGLPWREQNVQIKLDEYLPAGLEAVTVRVLPRPRFPGTRRP